MDIDSQGHTLPQDRRDAALGDVSKNKSSLEGALRNLGICFPSNLFATDLLFNSIPTELIAATYDTNTY